MRRFDDAQRLDRVCARGQLTAQHVSTLARAIVQLQDCAAVTTDPDGFGSATAALRPALDNLSICEQKNADVLTRARLGVLRQWTEQQASQLSPLFAQRLDQGWVRECHGDLHLGNMLLQDGAVRLFDCIEFNAGLRWIDVASDLAFAFMDLLHHGQGGLASWLLSEVLSATGDYGCAPVLRFYAVYRAMVRAKVAAIRLAQPGQPQMPVDPAEGSRRELQAYLGLAERLARPQALRLTITHGVSGCGKSVAAQQRLLQDAGGSTLRLRSDVERKRLFGLSALQRSGSALDNGLYSATAHAQTYARLAGLADGLLQAGWSVVVDAAFLRRSERQTFADLAHRHGAHFGIVAPQAQVAVLRQRIVARAAAGTDPSEATLEVLDKQLAWVEPLSADELLTCEAA
jgi:predicted kinase